MKSAIIIGGDLNGLVTANLLAKKGFTCTVYEQRAACGGLASSEVFLEGFSTPGLLHDTALFDPRIVKALQLESHGLTYSGPTHRMLLRPNEAPLSLSENGGVSAWFKALKPVVTSLYQDASPDLLGALKPGSLMTPGIAALKAGRANVLEWTRLMPQCAEDTLAEWIDVPEERALWTLPSLFGTYMSPLSPSSTVTLALYWSQVGQQVKGGAQAIIDALLKASAANGVQLKTNTTVSNILVENGQAVGVVTDQGEHRADRVFSTLGVAHTGLNLLAPGTLLGSVEQRLGHIRSRGNLAKLHIAIQGDIPWSGTPGTQYQIGGHPLDLERAFDASNNGVLPDRPALDISVPSLSAPQLAPEGHHVLSVLVYAVPTADAPIWDDSQSNEQLLATVKTQLATVWPGFESQFKGAQVLNPRDISEQYGLPGGHLYHAEWALDQLWSFRPTGALARNRELIDGLIVAGSGTHGGGGLRGTAAFLAAKQHS